MSPEPTLRATALALALGAACSPHAHEADISAVLESYRRSQDLLAEIRGGL